MAYEAEVFDLQTLWEYRRVDPGQGRADDPTTSRKPLNAIHRDALSGFVVRFALLGLTGLFQTFR
jgi:hypothetical protein